ncbi:MAG: GFA family protein [Alphaproteobacteria bacterium]|nr:GFA family protein [Alphaproteobacteria bacterium]
MSFCHARSLCSADGPGEAKIARKTTRRRERDDCVPGRCLCGRVRFEIDYPAFWAWHDHSRATRLAHGAAYATYVGCWRKHFRVTGGKAEITRYDDEGNTRSFCSRCGTPVLYTRKRAPHMVNIPRALFEARTGREPRYHVKFEELQDWTYTGEALAPLKGYPGVLWERPKRKKRRPALSSRQESVD